MAQAKDQLTKDQTIRQLKAQNDELENYFRNTIIPQLFFDKDLILRKFTPAAMKQFKLTEEDIGHSIHEIKNNLRYPSIIENINWVLDTSEILEKEIQTTDLCWYKMDIIPNLKKINNRPNGVIITFVDVTNRIKDLKYQEKIISNYDTLLDAISHEIKNRLTGMMLSLEFLNESDLEDKEDVKSLLGVLDGGVNKINQVISELFDFRNQKHKYEAVDDLVNIENVLEDVQLTLINEIEKSNAKIILEVNSSEIVFPRRQLRSIVYNLVSNSIKFRSSDRNPEIVIKTNCEDDQMAISVKDNGIGIDPGKQQDIFSKNNRIRKSVEGSGVGLHLIKSLVTKAGGKFEIDSQLDVGTEFRIYLKTPCNK